MTFLVEFELGGHDGDSLVGFLEFLLHFILFGLEEFDLLALALPGVVGCQSVAFHTLDTALLFLVFGLGSLPRRKIGLGLGKDLAPGLSLLDWLRLSVGSWARLRRHG